MNLSVSAVDVMPTVLDLVRDWRLDVYGLTLIVVMLFAPQGLAGVGRWLGRTASGLLSRGAGGDPASPSEGEAA